MNKMDNARLMRQGQYNLQDVVSEIQEVASVSEKLIKINSLMMSIASQANFLSVKVTEGVHARGTDEGLTLVAHEAYKLAEFSNDQSEAIWNMFSEIREYIGKINCSTNKVLGNLGVIEQGVMAAGEQRDSIHVFRAAGIGQSNNAAEIVDELGRMSESLSSLTLSVLRLKV